MSIKIEGYVQQHCMANCGDQAMEISWDTFILNFNLDDVVAVSLNSFWLSNQEFLSVIVSRITQNHPSVDYGKVKEFFVSLINCWTKRFISSKLHNNMRCVCVCTTHEDPQRKRCVICRNNSGNVGLDEDCGKRDEDRNLWTGIGKSDGGNCGSDSDMEPGDHSVWKDEPMPDAEESDHGEQMNDSY